MYALFLSHVNNSGAEKWFKENNLPLAEDWPDRKLNALFILRALQLYMYSLALPGVYITPATNILNYCTTANITPSINNCEEAYRKNTDKFVAHNRIWWELMQPLQCKPCPKSVLHTEKVSNDKGHM